MSSMPCHTSAHLMVLEGFRNSLSIASGLPPNRCPRLAFLMRIRVASFAWALRQELNLAKPSMEKQKPPPEQKLLGQSKQGSKKVLSEPFWQKPRRRSRATALVLEHRPRKLNQHPTRGECSLGPPSSIHPGSVFGTRDSLTPKN